MKASIKLLSHCFYVALNLRYCGCDYSEGKAYTNYARVWHWNRGLIVSVLLDLNSDGLFSNIRYYNQKKNISKYTMTSIIRFSFRTFKIMFENIFFHDGANDHCQTYEREREKITLQFLSLSFMPMVVRLHYFRLRVIILSSCILFFFTNFRNITFGHDKIDFVVSLKTPLPNKFVYMFSLLLFKIIMNGLSVLYDK